MTEEPTHLHKFKPAARKPGVDEDDEEGFAQMAALQPGKGAYANGANGS